MADVAIYAACDQVCGRFERVGGFSDSAEQIDPIDDQDQGCDEQDPGNNLMPAERVLEPGVKVNNKRTQDHLPGKETEEAV